MFLYQMKTSLISSSYYLQLLRNNNKFLCLINYIRILMAKWIEPYRMCVCMKSKEKM